jgi:hypothetical protein
MRMQTLRIEVGLYPRRIEDEDLREFAQHVSYRDRDTQSEKRIYYFPGEQRGEDAAMDLQIVLEPRYNTLRMIRARRLSRFFYKADE